MHVNYTFVESKLFRLNLIKFSDTLVHFFGYHCYFQSIDFASSAQPRHHRNVDPIAMAIAKHIRNSPIQHTRKECHWMGKVLNQ